MPWCVNGSMWDVWNICCLDSFLQLYSFFPSTSGYLRQCDIIPYSQDVDIGVFAKDYKKELLPAFLSHGFKLHHTFGEPNDSYQIAFEYNKIKLDIFFFYSEKNRQIVWNGGTEARSGYKFK